MPRLIEKVVGIPLYTGCGTDSSTPYDVEVILPSSCILRLVSYAFLEQGEDIMSLFNMSWV